MVRRLHIVYVLFFSVFFLPFVELSPNIPSIRPEWCILAAAIAVFSIERLPAKVFYWFLALAGTIVFSIIYGSATQGVSVNMADTFELLKPLLYFLFFTFARSVNITEAELHRFLRVMNWMFVVVGMLAILQYFGGGPVLNALLSIYAPAERIEIYVGSRATATMANPNDLGMLLTIGFALSVFTLRLSFPYRINNLFPFVLLLGVVASGSRTAMIASLLVAVIFFYRQKKMGRLSLKNTFYLLAALAVIAGVVVINAAMFSNTAYRLFLSSDDSANSSWIARFTNTVSTLKLIQQSPIFGWGVNKQGFEWGDNVDNEYILLLYRYGLVGLIVVIGSFAIMWKKSRLVYYQNGTLEKSYTYFLTAALIAAALFAYAAGIFHAFRLCTLIVLLIGVGASVQKREKEIFNGGRMGINEP